MWLHVGGSVQITSRCCTLEARATFANSGSGEVEWARLVVVMVVGRVVRKISQAKVLFRVVWSKPCRQKPGIHKTRGRDNEQVEGTMEVGGQACLAAFD